MVLRGVGKSTVAAEIFARLKRDNYSVELIREYVKNWAYEKRGVGLWDQWYIFGKQLRAEQIALQNGCNLIVTDCPLELGMFYGCLSDTPSISNLSSVLEEYEEQFPSLNIYIRPGDKSYVQLGRYHKESESYEIDAKLKYFLESHMINYQEFSYLHIDSMYRYIKINIE